MNARIRLLLSSYVPLFFVGAVRFDDSWLRVALGILVVAGIWSLISLIRVSTRRVHPREATATRVRDLGSEVAAYVATYLLPLMTVAKPGLRDLVAYALVLAVIGVVFVNSDLVGINPLLSLFGYRVFQVSGVRKVATGEEADTIVISRSRVVAGSTVKLADLAAGVALVISQTEDIGSDHPQRP